MATTNTNQANANNYATHYCGNCGEKMEFCRRQDSDYPMVYRCPQCGEREAFKE